MIVRTITQQILLLILQTSKTVWLESIITMQQDLMGSVIGYYVILHPISLNDRRIFPMPLFVLVMYTASVEISGSDTSTEAPSSPICTDWPAADPSLSKVLESIIGQWLLPVLEPAFDPNQFGCRRQRSTTYALVAMTMHDSLHLIEAGLLELFLSTWLS